MWQARRNGSLPYRWCRSASTDTRTAAPSQADHSLMDLALLLIVIGIVLAILVNYGLGLLLILIGLVLLLIPAVRGWHPYR